MIVVDTDIVSDVVRRGSTGWAARWLASQQQDEIWTTVITAYELEFGASLLPSGRRKDVLMAQIEQVLRRDLATRILPLDSEAASRAAALSASRRSSGLNIDIQDTLIAGIALSRNAVVATRKIRHFADAGLALIDPSAPG